MIEILGPHTSSFAIVVCSYFGRSFEDAMHLCNIALLIFIKLVYVLGVENPVLLVKLFSLVVIFARIVCA